MKQIVFLLFALSFYTSFAQLTKTEKSVSDKINEYRKEYDQELFTYSYTVSDKAGLYELKERYKRQFKLFQDVSKLTSDFKVGSMEDPTLLYEAGGMFFANQMYSEAQNIFELLLHYYKEGGQNKTQQFADLLSSLGLVYQNMGRYTLAHKYADSSAHLRQEIFPTESSQYAIAVNNLATLYRDLGNYEKAEFLISEAVRINEKALTKKSLYYALSLNNQAMLFQAMGRLQEAEPLMQEAIKIISDNLKERSTNYHRLMTNLALLYQEMGKVADAEIILLKVIKIKENSVGIGHPDYAHMLHLLASLYLQMDQEKQKQVEELLKKTAVIYKKVLGEKDPTYALSINDLGNYYRFKGNTKDALSLLQEALQIRKEELFPKNQEILNTLENLGLTYWQMRRMPEAAKALKEASDKTLEELGSTLSTMSEGEISSYWDQINARFQRFYSFAITQAKSSLSLTDEVFDYRINTKGIVLNAFGRTKESLMVNENAAFIDSYKNWLDQKENLARAYKLSKRQAQEEHINTDTLEKHALNSQKLLAEESRVFAKLYNTPKVTFKMIRDKLGPDDASLEIFPFYRFDKEFTDTTCYAALVVTKERMTGPEVILFGNGNDLEKIAFNSYKGNLKQKVKDEKSYGQFWEKIEQAVNAKTRIYISAAGVFNEINFNTILLPDGQYLIDRKNIIPLGNTKDIFNFKFDTAMQAHGNTAFLFGYPDYGPRGIVPRLPGTKTEVENLKELFTSNGFNTSMFIQGAATEQKVKTLKDPSVLHLATHAYFLDEGTENKNTRIFGFVPDGLKFNGCLMSGLLMAGAEKNISGENENGILRTSEIAKLSLDNTSIVFLSATETLYGGQKNGEGLFALQKAFKIAGAEAVIISLWKVTDQHAQEFCNIFYTEFIKSGNKYMAFNHARKSMKEKYPEPFYWGAFQLYE